MQQFIDSIRQSLKNENWLAALFISLALPDICRSAERPNIKIGETGKWYKDWVTRYFEQKYIDGPREETKFYAQDCWLFRCSCIHSGLNVESQKRMMHFVFTPPGPDGRFAHKCFLGDKLQLQIDIFCNDMIESVEKWLSDVEGDKEIQERINNLIKISLHTLKPYIDFLKY